MVHCSPGDQVLCRIKDNVIVSTYNDLFDETQLFDVVGIYDETYILHVPSLLTLKDSIHINYNNHKKYGLESKFIDINVCLTAEHKILRIYYRMDGMCCRVCKDFHPMASPNQFDNTLVCWRCRKYPTYM